MIDGLKPYPKMKDSGLPWLGDVPNHWDVRKLRHVLEAVTQRNRPDLPLLSVVRERGVIVRDVTDADENHNYIPDDLSNYKVVRRGQFAMNKMKAWQGSYGVSDFDGIVSPAYFVFELAGVAVNFFHLAIRSKAYIPYFNQASDGVRIGQWDLAQSRMREIPFAIPPEVEQAAIVRFLDHADRRIRRYIAAKQKLIKLLEEERQAIIHRAVTRGLDPSVRLKPSGVEWLGDVPEHWHLVPNRAMLRKRKVLVGKRHSDYQLLSLTKAGVIVRDVASGRGKFSADMGTSQEVRPGDLVFCLFDVPETPRTVGLSNHHGMITGAYTVFECHDKLLASFIEAFYIAMDDRKLLSPLYSGLRNTIPPSTFLGVKTPVPPPAEQAAIIRFLDEATSSLRAAIDRARREIDLLREYRVGLIADIVTGKLDVREAAAKLPDATPEVELLDEVGELPHDEESVEAGELEAEDAA
ncbi:restriction endonuclease subunit S [Enhydrobacter sp.]|jgi:type I restriction enzyme S subunit|uniref:restriction endonuclease subunit S n=1 Tax=Enhydrobacter sp. TaxID=1894999 RepID=UPI002625DAEC|nr:restriction endonuclease subunit S [Enhydrobacter sp.]WIM10534.1 MAG: Type I restriction-modification system, specificity subunit S [Enhydrobacter sp.]